MTDADIDIDDVREAASRPISGIGAWHMHFFGEIRDYTGFDEDDEALLGEMLPVVEPHIDDIVDEFYDALQDNPRTRAVFEDEAQMERLHGTLKVWLREVFEGPHDEDYVERRLRIGRAHVDVGLLPHFMFGAMTLIRIHLVDVILDPDEELPADRRPYLHAMERILDIELTIMLQSYWDNMMDMKLKVPAALATGLAHEIRNPLNAINLNLTLLDRRFQKASAEVDATPILESIRNEIRRIGSLASEIMDFAKPVEIQPAWHDARQLVDQLKSVHGPTLDVSNIELKMHVDGDPHIWIDLDRMKQALINLLTNAVQAIENEGTIEIVITNSDEGTTIVVEDDGVGMAPALKYRVFDLFYTTKAGGTGLGLPIVRKIVEAHDGAIDVTSKVGAGTKFTLYLPRPKLDLEPDAT